MVLVQFLVRLADNPLHPTQRLPASLEKNTKKLVLTTVLVVLVTQLVAFVFFCGLPTKVSRYAEVMVRMRMREDVMREEVKHVESERTGLREEREK